MPRFAQSRLGGLLFITVFPAIDKRVMPLTRGRVKIGARFEIPHGPAAELVIPGPQRLALYELTRPDAPERLANRRDF